MERIGAAEDALKDARLKFVQVTTLKGTADTQETKGELSFLKSPERFLVRFTSPVAQVIAYDGSHLTMFFPETEQAFRQKANAKELKMLLGVNPASPLKSFRKGYRAALDRCTDGSCLLSFEKDDRPGLVWRVKVSSSTWRLEEASFENEEVKVVLKCYDYLVNRGLSVESFALKMPRDTEIHEGIPRFFGGTENP